MLAAVDDAPPQSELTRLLALAAPAVLGQLGLMLMGVVDTIAVGRLGKDALAAVAIGSTWSFGVSIVAMGAATGLDPLIAQAFGAGDRQRAGATLVRGAVMLLVISVPVFVLHRFAALALTAIGEPVALVPNAGAYCEVLAWSVPPLLLFGLVRQFLQGDGRMRPAAIAVIVCNLTNLVANWALVYGHLGLPALGVTGSALATTLSRWLMLVLLVGVGWDVIVECWPGWSAVRDVRAIGRMLLVSVPVGLQVGTEVWAFLGTTMVMGWIGPTAVAAHMVALNLASLSFNLPFGISAAAATRVGNLLGAGQPWHRAAWTAVALGAGVMCVSATAFAVAPQLLARVYTSDPDVIALAASLLPIAALFQLFDGTQVVCFGVLRGAGDTRVPMLANLVGYWVLGLPIGAWLAFNRHWGPQGLWTGLTIGLATVAILLLFRLRSTATRGGFRVR